MTFPLVRVIFFVSLLVFCSDGLAGAQEQARLALVIGNAAYDAPATLKNPVNDATDVAEALKKAGWTITLLKDADRRAMTRAVVSWGDDLSKRPNASALFYYAGHGMQVDGSNYLLPIKTVFESVDDVKLDALNLSSITTAIEQSGAQVSLIVLDACRDNPFAKKGTRSLGGGTRGLNIVQGVTGVKDTAVMFSTSPGDVAQDGTGHNGVFTEALLHHILSDAKLEDMFKKVTAEVRQATGDKQKPWINASLGTDFYLLSDGIRQTRAAEAAQKSAEDAKKTEASRQAELDAAIQALAAASAKANAEASAKAEAAQAAQDAKLAALQAQLEAAQKQALAALEAASAQTKAAQEVLAKAQASAPGSDVASLARASGTIHLTDLPLNVSNVDVPGTNVSSNWISDTELTLTEVPVNLALTLQAFDSRRDAPRESVKLRVRPGETVETTVPGGTMAFPWLPSEASVDVTVDQVRLRILSGGEAYQRDGPKTTAKLLAGEYQTSLHLDYLDSDTLPVTISGGKETVVNAFAPFLQKRLETKRDLARKAKSDGEFKTTAGWVSVAVGVLSAITAGTVYSLGTNVYSTYQGSNDASAVNSARSTLTLYGTIWPVAAVVGGVGIVTGAVLVATTPTKKLQDSLNDLDLQIQRFRVATEVK